jgi:hypothetical protein
MLKRRRQSKQSPSEVEEDVSSGGNVFSASARGASYLILLQLFTRLLTFTFNQLILRHTNPSVFGFATIQLELLSSTILFLSREGFRIALQRERGEIQRTVNLAFVPFVTGIFGALVGCYGFWRGADAEVKGLGGFKLSIMLYVIAAVVELFSEPCFAVAQQMLMFRVRTLAEGFAVVMRCAVTYVTTAQLSQRGRLDEFGAVPFGVGQLAYAIVLAGVYLFVISKRVNLLPRHIVEKGNRYFFHRPTLWLAFSVTGQSLFKHLLTEGDKFVLTVLTTPYTQGIYAVVSNYGISNQYPTNDRLSNSTNPLPTSRRNPPNNLIETSRRSQSEIYVPIIPTPYNAFETPHPSRNNNTHPCVAITTVSRPPDFQPSPWPKSVSTQYLPSNTVRIPLLYSHHGHQWSHRIIYCISCHNTRLGKTIACDDCILYRLPCRIVGIIKRSEHGWRRTCLG